MPTAVIVATGSELTMGRIANTNAQWLSARLLDLGFDVQFHIAVGDRMADLARAFSMARTDLVLVTGGLGPTADDMTRPVVTRITGRKMVTDRAALAAICGRLERLRIPLTERNARQALVPRGAEVFQNPAGMAPGFALRVQGRSLVALPGVPREMKAIFDSAPLQEFLQSRFRLPHIETLDLVIAGVPESQVDERLGRLSDPEANPGVGILIRDGAIVVRVRSEAKGARVARARLEKVARQIRRLFRGNYVGEGDASLESAVLDALERRGFSLALAESCTGGLVAHRLTQVPGASKRFLGGMVAYTEGAKSRLVGVPAGLIRRRGVVSREVARALAEGAARKFGADVGAGVTGIAGPGGGTAATPLGTVHLAVCVRGRTVSAEHHFPGDRSDVKARAARALLDLLRRTLSRKA